MSERLALETTATVWDVREAALIEADPVRVTVAGHANTGKSAWLGSFLGMKLLSADEEGTTRSIEPTHVCLPGRADPYLILYDVPGQTWSSRIFQEAVKLYGPHPTREQLEEMLRGADGSADHPHFDPRWQADIRLLRHFLECDLVLFVADCQNLPSADEINELVLIRTLRISVVAILNFVPARADPADDRVAEWEKRLGSQIPSEKIIRYDAFLRHADSDSELRDQILGSLGKKALKRKFAGIYWDSVMRNRLEPLRQASTRLAGFLIDAATLRLGERCTAAERAERQPALRARLETLAAEKENALISAFAEDFRLPVNLLREYLPDGTHLDSGPLSEDRWNRYGGTLGVAAGVGALAGLGFDALFGGITGGAHALMGAAAGAALSTFFRKEIEAQYDAFFGRLELRLTPGSLANLAGHALDALAHLHLCGASRDIPLPRPAGGLDPALLTALTQPLAQLDQPDWCSWLKEVPSANSDRARRAAELSERIFNAVLEHARTLHLPAKGKIAQAAAGAGRVMRDLRGKFG